MNERIFGTDGIRGRAGEGWLSKSRVAALGSAIGDVLGRPRSDGRRPSALLGHDGRRSGPELEAALARGLAQHGFEIASCGLIPTQGLALLTRLQDFQIGVMISASHNPAEDNGIKIFVGGEKLSDETERAIEARLIENDEGPEEGVPPTLNPKLELDYLSYLIDHAAKDLKLDVET